MEALPLGGEGMVCNDRTGILQGPLIGSTAHLTTGNIGSAWPAVDSCNFGPLMLFY